MFGLPLQPLNDIGDFAMRVLVEFKPRLNIWVFIPTVILFAYGSEGKYTEGESKL